MSQCIERQDEAERRSYPVWGRGAASTFPKSSHAGDTDVDEAERLAAASAWLRAAPRRVAGLAGENLIAAVAQIEDAYDQFPSWKSTFRAASWSTSWAPRPRAARPPCRC